jgi:hypothetical protein
VVLGWGIDVKLGDRVNGFVAEDRVQYGGQVEPWLRDKAIEHFPDSLFARMYWDGLSVWLTSDEPADYELGDWRPSSG